MTRHPETTARLAGERGIALITTIMMMVLMSALLVGFTSAVVSDQNYRTIDRDRARAFYGAQSGIEKQNADLARLFINQAGASDAAVTALGDSTNWPTIPNVTFVDIGASPAYAVTPLGPPANGIVSSGPYEGLMALKRRIQLDATARSIDGGEVHLRRVVEAVAIPVFQFGIFSDVDLAFNAADQFDFGGRVHTNRNLYLAEGSSSRLYLRDKVTAVGEVIRTHLSNGVAIGSAGQTGTVYVTRGNSTGPFRHLSTNEGSLVNTLGSALNNSWPTVSLSTYVGNIRNGRTGVKPLNLDLVAANGVNIDLIKRPPSTEAPSSAIFAERYFRKVSVRVLLSDDPNDITSLPTVSATAPVLLDGDWSTAVPAGYGPVDSAHPPVARSAGAYPDVPVGAVNARTSGAVATGTSVTIGLDTSGSRPFPAYFKMPTDMVLSWNGGASSMQVTCTGKTATTLQTCSVTGGPLALPQNVSAATITATVPTLDGNRVVTLPVTTNIGSWNSGTRNIVVGTSGFPTAPLSVNTFFIRDKNIQVTCTGYDDSGSLRRFTGCNVPASIASGDMFETAYLSDPGTGTLGGYLKVEIQTSPDVWQDVTMEWLNYGISGPNLLGKGCGDPTPNAILRLQRLRDNGETGAGTCSYAGSTLSSDHWPNVFHDAREALSRDAAPASHGNRVLTGGLMHYVGLDAANLSSWFAGQGAYAAGTGGLAMREGNSATGGFSVYFSDRRNNRDSGNRETGEWGWEDIINPGSGSGAPDGVLNDGEDVNANGLLDTYGGTPSYNGNFGAVPPGALAPLDASADPRTLVSGGRAKVNRAIFFRRALKVFNGSIGTLVAPGLTIAAENPVYLQGDWNASVATGWTGNSVATSIAADTVVALSNIWNDTNSFGSYSNLNPWSITGRRRSSQTYYRVALISGKGTIFPAGSVGGTFGTDGGAHNFIRYIEGDASSTDLVNYMGSMVTFYYNRQNLMPHKCCGGIVYGVPNRNYAFDINFLDPAKLPPLTPAFRDINALGFSQETRPGK
ncbi:MAG: hypothetical protein R2708_19805 [Vicinamibacterales bacterium]